MILTTKLLPSGHTHIRGNGPCNWAQVPSWPCTAKELQNGVFPEAGHAFRDSAERQRKAEIGLAGLL